MQGTYPLCDVFLLKLLSGKADEKERTVLWVDDTPGNLQLCVPFALTTFLSENNKDEVALAAKHGIDCVQKVSTAEAKEFLGAHPELQHASPSSFRIITDLFRPGEVLRL